MSLCHTLCIIIGASHHCCARYGWGNGPMHLDYLNCAGSEFKVLECSYSDGNDDSHHEDWSVTCHPGIIIVLTVM